MELPRTKGTYILIVSLDEDKNIVVGRLGKMRFPRALYAYVGSAHGPGGIRARIERHIRKNDKRKFWHIDYLLEHADVKSVLIIKNKRLECYITRILREIGLRYIPSFGSSDCECESHLFLIKDADSPKHFLESKKIKIIEVRFNKF